MNLFRSGWRWLADDPHQQRGVRILQVAIGLMLLFRVFTEGPFAAYLWGPAGVGSGSTEGFFGASLGKLFDFVFESQPGTIAVVVLLGVGALGLVFGYRTRLSTGLALLTLLLLEVRLPDLPDGGDNIARIVLCYMLFLIPAGAQRPRCSLSVWTHNIAVLAIATQVMVLYSVAGLTKAYGDLWHHGTAMYYISQVQWFSLPAMRDVFKSPFVTTILSYATVLYEVWFPVAVISPLRRTWIVIGVLFHVGIAFFMGLITFSIAMIALDLVFITDQEYAYIKEIISGWCGVVPRYVVCDAPKTFLLARLLTLRSRKLTDSSRADASSP